MSIFTTIIKQFEITKTVTKKADGEPICSCYETEEDSKGDKTVLKT